jgi:hypothetical protein
LNGWQSENLGFPLAILLVFFTCGKIPYTNKIGYNLFITYSEISIQGEERLVAELAQLGVNYLSRQAVVPTIPRLPRIILAELVRQPSSRVRTAVLNLASPCKSSICLSNSCCTQTPWCRRFFDLETLLYRSCIFATEICDINK